MLSKKISSNAMGCPKFLFILIVSWLDNNLLMQWDRIGL